MRRAVAVHAWGTWPASEAVATVTLGFDDRHRRRIRFRSDNGLDFLLDLADAVHLSEGDGLELEDGGFVRVRAALEALAEIECGSAAELARVAWHLGNRHLAVQISGDKLLIRDDHVIVHMVEHLGARVRHVQAPFDPERGAYAVGASHDHDHDHH
jgi:urease accessory protein